MRFQAKCVNIVKSCVRYYTTPAWERYLYFSSSCNDKCTKDITNSMVVIDDFLSNDEEQSLLSEVEPHISQRRYEFDHWDNAIHGYRETEKLNWNKGNTAILQKVRDKAFLPTVAQLRHVHVLDLAEKGVIKPHIDSIRFCGNVIAGLSLLSDAVMRLVHQENKDMQVDILLKRRSLYIMTDEARYEYTHEILAKDLSFFKDTPVNKTRRLSIICRNEPVKS